MTHDAGHWDQRYTDDPAEGSSHLAASPDPAVVAAVQPLPPGRALDLATGLGRHARWLAAAGWVVTAVDFSAVGIARARDLEAHDDVIDATASPPRRAVASITAKPAGTPIDWVVADVRSWTPGHSPYDLVLVAFVHLDAADFTRLRTWLASGGHLVVVSHAPDAAGGPRDRAYRYDEQQLRAAAQGLTIEQITAQDGVLTLVARHL